MLFADRIKELREKKQMYNDNLPLLWKLTHRCTVKLSVATGVPNANRLLCIAKLLQTDEDMLVTLWVADKIITAIGDEKEFAEKAFKIVQTQREKLICRI
jgi:hypothetical protein